MKKHSKKLRRKAELWANKLGKKMGVRAIFLSGSLAQNKVTKQSDIDFFFISKQKQIWTARFFVFLWLKLHKEISTEKNHSEKICPNHFISEDNLEIQEKDAYSANLFSHNIPLFDPENIFPHFVQENQKWVQQFGESFDGKYLKIKLKTVNISKKQSFFFKSLELFLKYIQINKIKRNKQFNLPKAKIILTEKELRFHPKPKNKNYNHIKKL